MIFIVMFVILAVNNRIAHDDYYSIYIVNKFGIIDSVIFQYNNWCPRYFSVFISFVVACLSHHKFVLMFYNISLLLLICVSVYFLVRNGIGFIENPVKVKRCRLLNISIFIVSAIFYSSIKIGETWFWLASSSTYLLSIIVLLLAVAFIINGKTNTTSYIIVIFSSLFIGGSNGSLSLFILLFQLIIIGLLLKNKYGNATKKSYNKDYLLNKIGISFISCLLAFIVLYLGPGNKVRESCFDSIGIFESVLLNFKTTGMIIFLRLPHIAIYLVIFSIPVYWIGMQKKEVISMRVFLKKLVLSTLFLGISIFLFQLPITYKTQDIAADRALFPLSIILLLYSFYLSYNLARTKMLLEGVVFRIILTSLLIITSLNIKNLIVQNKITKAYSVAYDNRINILKESTFRETIVLEPLPNSGFLYSAEISSDTKHFNNQHLKQGLCIESEIKICKKPTKPTSAQKQTNKK